MADKKLKENRDVVIAPFPIPERLASEQSRKVEIAMRNGDSEACVAAIENAFEMARERAGAITKETHVQEAFSERIAQVLEKVGASTVGDVILLTPERLEVQPNCASGTIQKIQQTLVEAGFSLSRSA